jgi:hypothetical protein
MSITMVEENASTNRPASIIDIQYLEIVKKSKSVAAIGGFRKSGEFSLLCRRAGKSGFFRKFQNGSAPSCPTATGARLPFP